MTTAEGTILSAEDRASFEENGYIHVKGLVPPEQCEAVVDAIFAFLRMDRSNPDDWYRPPLNPRGFVELYHHHTMWEVRQEPKLHQVFSELWGTEKLWVSLDRVGFKPPRNEQHLDYDDPGFIHWDADTSQWPLPFSLQGVLYLTDTAEDQGGWQGIPGIHRRFDEWVKTQPADRDPRNPDVESLERLGMPITRIAGQQGDMVIWVRALAHGNGHNVSGKPRFAQYITMSPAKEDDEEGRRARIESFERRVPPRSTSFKGDDRGWEQTQPAPRLTPLGQRLLGLDHWA
jgi:ectoine hydroxylase-related dioxygenase (phytanoyl-CoA dioxygenase family)